MCYRPIAHKLSGALPGLAAALLLSALVLGFALAGAAKTTETAGLYAPNGKPFAYQPVDTFVGDPLEHQVFLEMVFARARIRNKHEWSWPAPNRIIEKVELVYTQYPADTTQWLTNFKSLQLARIDSLLALDPAFAADHIEWVLVPQTAPRTHRRAVTFRHGFNVTYRLKIVDEDRLPLLLRSEHGRVTADMLELAMQDLQFDLLRRLTTQADPLIDSTVFSVLDQHPEWNRLHVVLDWTGSMYPYGAQVLRWMMLDTNARRLRYLTLFNDGDDFVNRRRKKPKAPGKVGGIYTEPGTGVPDLIRLMDLVMRRGAGAEPMENDVEALTAAANHADDYDQLVLIADRNSPMRDLELSDQVKRPVKIILCGTDGPGDYTGEYMQLAMETGGSVHSMQEELDFWERYMEPSKHTNRTFLFEGARFRIYDNGRVDIIGRPVKLGY